MPDQDVLVTQRHGRGGNFSGDHLPRFVVEILIMRSAAWPKTKPTRDVARHGRHAGRSCLAAAVRCIMTASRPPVDPHLKVGEHATR